jgi:ribosome-binding factor A
MMREFSRKDRLKDQIIREVADIVQNHLKDPKLGFVTITDSELTNDLRYAKVFCSVLGEEKDRQESFQILQKSAGVIQSELARRLNIRRVPLLTFEEDTSAEYGARMEKLFKEIEREREERSGEDDAEE